MIIKSLSGSVIIETNHKTMKGALEYCAALEIDLTGADLRRARLTDANLDGLYAPMASFWGANLRGADIGFSTLKGADMRNADFKDACLAESDLTSADLRGSYFSSTIIEGACLGHAQTSCPSFWNCDLQSAADIDSLVFWHRGEHALRLKGIPLVVHGLKHDLVIGNDFCVWGKSAYPSGLLPHEAQKSLFSLKTSIEKIMRGCNLQNSAQPILKNKFASEDLLNFS